MLQAGLRHVDHGDHPSSFSRTPTITSRSFYYFLSALTDLAFFLSNRFSLVAAAQAYQIHRSPRHGATVSSRSSTRLTVIDPVTETYFT